MFVYQWSMIQLWLLAISADGLRFTLCLLQEVVNPLYHAFSESEFNTHGDSDVDTICKYVSVYV